MVPEGWTKTTLGEHVRIHSGYAPASLNLSSDGNVPYVKVEDMNNCSRVQLISRENALHEGRVLPTNTVIFPKRGAAILNNKVRITGAEIILDTNMMGLEALDTLDPWFAYYRLVFEQLFKIADTSTIPQINNKHINPHRLQLPPLPEQRKIADILSTWDQAIEKTEALLSNARTQKRALMQQLLTGKRRFPAFEGQPWKEVRLGDLGKFRKGKGLPKTVVGPEGEYACVLYGELYTTYGEFIDQTKSRTDVDDGIISVAGDILIPASTTTSGIDLAIASCVSNDGVRLGGDINIFRSHPDAIDGAFLAYFLTHTRRHQMARFAQGITIVHLKGSDLLDLMISVPPMAEQKLIMSVVSKVESEIVSIATDLTKLRTEKKALMQQLLTGKRRVVV